jgi:hypothetical protein
MAFAICPDQGYPRIWRYVDTMPPDIVATLDRAQNVLVINKPLYDQLDDLSQVRVLRTHAAELRLRPSRGYLAVNFPFEG